MSIEWEDDGHFPVRICPLGWVLSSGEVVGLSEIILDVLGEDMGTLGVVLGLLRFIL